MKRFLSLLATGALALGLSTSASAQVTRGLGGGALILDDHEVPPHTLTIETPQNNPPGENPEWNAWQADGFPNLWIFPVPPMNGAQGGFIYSGPLSGEVVPHIAYWLPPGQNSIDGNGNIGGAAGAWDYATAGELGLIGGSGSPNVIAKWNGAGSALTNSSVLDDGTTFQINTGTPVFTVDEATGNTGIGTTPASNIGLFVSEPFGSTSALEIHNTDFVGGSLPENIVENLSVGTWGTGSGQTEGRMLRFTEASSGTLFDLGISNLDNFYLGNGDGVNGELITVTPGGDVGIGVTSPSSLFSVGTGATSNFTVDANGNTTIVAGDLNIPATTSSSVGVINAGGARWMFNYPDGNSNEFFGLNSGNFTMTTANSDLGVGPNVLQSLNVGQQNTGVGAYALVHSDGNNNTGAGYNSLNTLTSGSDNTAVGNYSGYTINGGSQNTFLGSSADANGDYSNATAIGYGASVGASNTIQLGNGSVALVNTSGAINTAIGYQVSGAATLGNYLRGDGTNFVSSAIQASDIPDLSGTYVVLAPSANQTIQPTADVVPLTLNNFAGGTADLLDLTDGSGNSMASFNAGITGLTLGNSTGGNKQGILRLYSTNGTVVTVAPNGSAVLDVNNNFQADGNIDAHVAGGVYQINGNTVLSIPGPAFFENTFVGHNAGNPSVTGDADIALGTGSMQSVGSGTDDVAIGFASLGNMNSGHDNTGIGSWTGLGVSTGNYNTFLGREADATGDYTGSTAIGYQARVGGSNQMQLGGASLTAISTYGHIVTQSTVGTATFTGDVSSATAAGSDVAGTVTFSNTTTGAASTITVPFANGYGAAPIVVLTPADPQTAAGGSVTAMYVTEGTANFVIHFVLGAAETNAVYNYMVIQP